MKRANGDGTVFWNSQRERWLAAVVRNGKIVRRTIPPEVAGTDSQINRKKALRWLEGWIADLAIATEPPPPRTVEQQMRAYLAMLETTEAKPRTIKTKRAAISGSINPGIGSIYLADLRPAHVRALYKQMRDKKRAANYIRVVHYALSAAFAFARTEGFLDHDPLAGVSPPAATKRTPPVVGGDIDLRAFLDAIHGRAWETALIVAFACGLRNHELRALRWQDIDTDHQEIHVYAGTQPGKQGEVRGTTKSGAGVRRVAYGTAVQDAFDTQRALNAARRLKAGKSWKDNDLVWPNTTGGILDESMIEKAMTRAMKAAGLPHLWPHALRHAFATNVLEGDVDLATVSRAAGHASVRVTADVYVQATRRADRKVANAIDAVFSRLVSATVSDSADSDGPKVIALRTKAE